MFLLELIDSLGIPNKRPAFKNKKSTSKIRKPRKKQINEISKKIFLMLNFRKENRK